MPRFRFSLVPRDETFFQLFAQGAGLVQDAAELLHDLVTGFEDVAGKARRLHDLEHEADEVTHLIMKRLNTTFVTPLDHEDVHRLASTLDDVMDHIDAAGDLFVLHKIEQPFPDMKAQTDVLVRTARVTRQALETLPRYSDLPPFWVEINRLENEGDQIYRKTVAHLFSGDYKGLEVLRHRDVVEEIEAAIDSLEDVANTIESIVLKHA